MSAVGSVLDFGRASVGVEIVRMVTLQNVGKSPAVFCVEAPELKQVRAFLGAGSGIKAKRVNTVVRVFFRYVHFFFFSGGEVVT